jgi:high-affinity Fe2+/Pb2+ permease
MRRSRPLKRLLVALGAIGGIYCAVELARIIWWYKQHVRWLAGFGLEYFLIAVAIVWILVSAYDDLFHQSDLLGG